MPFTFSHPAIVLPLKYLPKKWFSFTGLIIGSMTPDFEYFIRMKVQSNYSHTIAGILWFDLPLALLLSFIFHNIVRNQLFENLPNCIKSRFQPFITFNWNTYFIQNWIVVLISILIGTASHLFWDSFTHDHGYFVNHIPELKEPILIFEKKVPLLKLAQHFSSLIGAAIILFSISKLPKSNILKNSTNKNYWFSVLSLSIIIFSFRFTIGLTIKEYGHIVVSAISSFLFALILIPLLFKFKSDS
ncbi:DUF4184 family protein [Flavobacterium johnsoniae]|uniref:DUF4184 family protein n=1 Tax=Flavobacterium johnsoniae TaxID=986 RepID=A0A1J7BWS1_FLAJO|nr:DUF4184 family protein [Flavobacterium johnsoniae]OIV43102.1 hypothetical protein BKM63_02505 [Flavobacterium johnsoniae]